MNRDDLVRVGVAVGKDVGPVGARRARDEAGGWAAAEAGAERLAKVLTPAVSRALVGAARRGERVCRACAETGVRILFRGDPDWPPALECLTDVPEVLFLRGRVQVLRERGVAIVGTRECSASGADLTRDLGSRLAAEGWVVVSGLARGIDASAHLGALDAGGDTIAVLGCGPDLHYPEENRALQEAIARDGLLVSEFAPGAPPVKGHFPRRNRILAALVHAVVVVESRLRSGAHVTTRHALDQGKEVFVVPGWPTSPVSAGPLALLRDGARPIRHAADLLEDLGGISGGPAAGPEEIRALDVLREGASRPDELARELGIDLEDARERLARLELLGLHTPGG
jgi:DNA processing protein